VQIVLAHNLHKNFLALNVDFNSYPSHFGAIHSWNVHQNVQKCAKSNKTPIFRL